jgi:hypothetical protein
MDTSSLLVLQAKVNEASKEHQVLHNLVNFFGWDGCKDWEKKAYIKARHNYKVLDNYLSLRINDILGISNTVI